jgi:Phage protein Gp138 N-terminal domain
MYTPPTIPFNLQPANPGLKDLLDSHAANTQSNFNCHAVGTIQSFYQAISTNGTNGLFAVTATINYSRTYFVRQPTGGYVAQQEDYPMLIDCPAIILSGGSTYLQMPIQQGDQCLILFNDRDLNNWFAGAASGPVASSRLHSFSDGIALVGFAQGKISSFDAGHALITNGAAAVGVEAASNGTRATVRNATYTLGGVLTGLVSTLNTFLTTTSTATTAAQIAAAAATALPDIAQTLTQISDLLE